MATRLEDEFDPTRINAPDAAYPAGSLKDETTPGVSDDGTPLASRVGNDWQGFSQSVLDKAGIAANGQPDSVSNPQILQAIEQMYNDGDSQLAGGPIWPLSSQDSAAVNDTLVDIPFIRLDIGGEIQQFALIAKDGSTEAATGNLDSIDTSFNPVPSITVGGVEYWCRIRKYYNPNRLTIKQFGATSTTDQSYNNTPALVAMRNVVRGRGGYSAIEFEPNGDGEKYYWEQWKENNPDVGVNDQSFYGKSAIFDFTDLVGIAVIGNNAQFSPMDNTRTGSFDPVTGAVAPASTNNDFQNASGDFFRLQSAKIIKISDVIVDGNNLNYILGGPWGSGGGYQVNSIGVRCNGDSEQIHLENLKMDYMGTDGYALGVNSPTDTADPMITFINCSGTYNGRQGLSHTGGNFVKFIKCNFSHTGRGGLNSSPDAGVDIEPESSRYVVGCVWDTCTMIDNVGNAFLTAVSSPRMYNNKVVNSTLQGTDNATIFCTAPSTIDLNPVEFVNCEIYGQIIRCENVIFNDCLITDIPNAQFPTVFNANYITENYTRYTRFIDCKLELQFSRFAFNGRNFSGCTMIARYDQDTYNPVNFGFFIDGDYKWGDNTFIDAMTGTVNDVLGFGSLPDNPHTNTILYAIDRNTGDVIPWRDPGEIRRFQFIPENAVSVLHLTNNASNSSGNGNPETAVAISTASTVPPTSGTFQRGRILIKTTMPGDGNSYAEVCSTAGDAGVTAVFKPIFNINQTP